MSYNLFIILYYILEHCLHKRLNNHIFLLIIHITYTVNIIRENESRINSNIAFAVGFRSIIIILCFPKPSLLK